MKRIMLWICGAAMIFSMMFALTMAANDGLSKIYPVEFSSYAWWQYLAAGIIFVIAFFSFFLVEEILESEGGKKRKNKKIKPQSRQTVCRKCDEIFEFNVTSQMRVIGENIRCPHCGWIGFVEPSMEAIPPAFYLRG